MRDLYKGANSKSPIGTGSTADAIRHELATGQAVGGKFHSQKGTEYARALANWLGKNANASPGFAQVYDEHVADHDEVLPHVLLGELVRFLSSEVELHGAEAGP